MSRVFLTPFVIVGLLFLPSCSNAEAKACEAAESSRANYAYMAQEMQAEFESIDTTTWEQKKMQERYELGQEAKANYELSLQVIMNYSECFTPEQVVEAQLELKKLN